MPDATSRRPRRLFIATPLAVLADGAAGGVVVEGTRIVELVPSGGRPTLGFDETFDASRHVVLPGLINTHHHFYQTLTRAHPAAINKPLFPWLKALYPIWARLDPESFALAVQVALVELLLSGCTTAADHHYLYPAGLDEAVDIEVDAARAIGMRMTVLRGSMNLSVKDGGLPPDSVVQDADTILADCERVLARYHDRSAGALTQVALAPCSPFSVTPELMRDTAALAEQADCTLHTHLGETRDENDYCAAVYKCRPVDLLDDTGWLGPRTWLAHGIHFTADECEQLGRAGVGVCHCPTSNATLASGFCPVHALERAGAPVGLGVDGSASNDASNMMESVRHALMLARLGSGDADSFTHLDALRLATEGSARCLNRNDIGRIEVGREADLAMFTLDELRFSGGHDPLATLVLSGAHRADRVMVAGRWRVLDGQPVGVDVADLIARHSLAARRFA